MRLVLITVLISLFLLSETHLCATSYEMRKIYALEDVTNPNRNLLADSIISESSWRIPSLKEKCKYRELFGYQRLLVAAYLIRDDVNQATRVVRDLQKSAYRQNDNYGIAQAGAAMADLYFYRYLLLEARDAYAEALEKFGHTHSSKLFRKQILLKMLHIARLEDNVSNLEECIRQIKMLGSDSVVHIDFLLDAYTSYCWIKTSQLEIAEEMVCRLENELHRSPDFLKRYIFYLLASDFQYALGNYDKALSFLTDSLEKVTPLPNMRDYTLVEAKKATVYEGMQLPDSAAVYYEKIWLFLDSLATQAYYQDINDVRCAYQTNNLLLENKTNQNNLLLLLIIAIAMLLAICMMIYTYLGMKNKELKGQRMRQIQLIRKAEKAIQIKNTFLSNMSHEIRTPLNAIVGFSSLLVSETDETSVRQFNSIIKSNSELLLQLINDVIDLSHLNIGEIKYNFQKCDLVQLCHHVVETVGALNKTQANLSFVCQHAFLEIETDDNRLRQVLINLLVNAAKFTPDGSITLILRVCDNREIEFSVTDTGCGISPETRQLLFERFGTTHDSEHGFGLGLSISQLIVQQLGGRIWIDSTYTQGARFMFTHPLYQGISEN